MTGPKLPPDQFRQELRRMVASPAWAQIPDWFTEVMVRRILRGSDPLGGAAASVHERRGALMLLMSIENEIGGSNATIEQQRLTAASAELERQDGQRQGAARPGQQAAAEAAYGRAGAEAQR